jgi:hypothetical protein
VSWSWYLYTTRAPADVIAVEAELEAALDAYFEDHDDGDSYAEHGAGGGAPPKPDDVVAYRERFRETVDPAILTRLGQCRTTMSFDYVRDRPEDSPIQVSILKVCLDRLAPCVFDWGDLSLELGEIALARLAKLRSRRLDVARKPAPAPRRPVKRRAAKPGEVRALRVVAALANAEDDPDLAVDLHRALDRIAPLAKRYVHLLAEDGAMDDATAAKRLDVEPAVLGAVIGEVDAVLDALD